MRTLAWLLVVAVSAISGGYAIPMGLAFGLSGPDTYVATLVGSVIALGATIFVANRFWSRLEPRLPTPPDPESRLGRFIDRFGVRGLGLVGPIFPGVTAALLIGLVLRVDRRSLLIWLSIGVAFIYAVYVAVLVWLIDLVGLN